MRSCIGLLALASFALPGMAHEEAGHAEADHRPNLCKKEGGDQADRDKPCKGPSHEELLRLIERFDVDRDGRLNDEEKTKLLAFLQHKPNERDGANHNDDGENHENRGDRPDGGPCERDHQKGPPDKFRPDGPPKHPPAFRRDGPKGPPPFHRDDPKGPPRDDDCCCRNPNEPGARPGPKDGRSGPPQDKDRGGSKGNNGVGNGVDPQPPGNPPVNDGPGTGPGRPGNKQRK